MEKLLFLDLGTFKPCFKHLKLSRAIYAGIVQTQTATSKANLLFMYVNSKTPCCIIQCLNSLCPWKHPLKTKYGTKYGAKYGTKYGTKYGAKYREYNTE